MALQHVHGGERMNQFTIPRAKTPEVQELQPQLNVQRIDPQEDTEIWEQVGALRAETYVHERKFLEEDVLDGNGREYDTYDERSHHYGVFDKEKLVGYARIVTRGDDPHNKLPAEELFGIELEPNATEISRLITKRSRNSSLVTIATIRALTEELKKPEYAENTYAVLETFLRTYLNDFMGIKTTEVADPRDIEKYNTVNSLVSMQARQITAQVAQLDISGERRSLPGMPENLGPFFEDGSETRRGLGAVAGRSAGVLNPERFERNLGFMSREELQQLHNSTVAIAGAGGDGGQLAIELARMGVGSFKLADPEGFETQNFNRQAGANYLTVGRNKAEVIAEEILKINPDADIELFTDGVNPENVAAFVKGANIVVDETEFTMHELGVMISRAARKEGLPVLMALNVGYGAQITMYPPYGKEFERHLGLDPKMSLEDIARQEVSIDKWLAYLPSYADTEAFKKVAAGQKSAPSIAPGVQIAAGIAATYTCEYLLSDITPARKKRLRNINADKNRLIFVDAFDGTKKIRHPRLSLALSSLRATLRTKLGKNPPTDY